MEIDFHMEIGGKWLELIGNNYPENLSFPRKSIKHKIPHEISFKFQKFLDLLKL